MAPRPVDGRHALYAGWIAGIAQRAGLAIEPVLIDGRVTDTFEVKVMVIRPGSYTVRVTVVVPEPPDDWHLDG